MGNDKFTRIVEGAAEAAALTVVLIAILTIGGELYTPLKDWLKAVFTHHWLGKSALSIIFFVLVLLARSRGTSDMMRVRRAVYLAAVVSVLMFATILAFFAYELFSAH